jgi:hypothetical protein
MFTDSAHDVKSASDAAPGFFTRTADSVRQFICGLHGHDALLHFEHGRMSLLCASCGHESPGWEVKGAALKQAVETTPRPVRVAIVRERRVA